MQERNRRLMKKKDKETLTQSPTKTLLRIAVYLKPFAMVFVSLLFLNTMFSALTTASVSIIKPIFQILFKQDVASAVPTATGGGMFDGLKAYYDSFIASIVSTSGDLQSTLINLGIMIICLFVLKNIFKYMAFVVGVKLNEGIIKSIRDSLFAKITSLSIDFFVKKKEGELISVLTNDVNIMSLSTYMSITTIIREGIQIVLFLLLLLSVSVKLTLIAFSTSIISLLIISFFMKYLRRYASRMQTAMADYTAVLQETVSGIRVVKAYGAEESVLKRFMNQTAYYVRSCVKHERITTIIPSFNEVFAIFALCVVLLVGGMMTISGEMGPDDLMLFLFSLFSIMSPVSTLVGQVSQFQRGIVAASRVFNIVDAVPNVQSGTEKIAGFADRIKVDNVSFAYSGSAEVIREQTLEIPKGAKVAFVGASGSGKSTMLDLITRFYDPTSGTISIDGRDIRSLLHEDYLRLFGIVAQETILFNDTIANNIRFGFDTATDEEVQHAARISNAYGFIMNMPEGFNTIVGDRGVMLSGGERQRVSIARALLRNPEILVFDEATSALDSESEKVVQQAIDSSMEKRTAIMVAHRLATVINCDKIFVFDRGRVVESGSHAELYAMGGVYRKLYDIQFASRGE